MRALEWIAALNAEAAHNEEVNKRRSAGLCAVEVSTGVQFLFTLFCEPKDADKVVRYLGACGYRHRLLPTLSGHGLTRDQSEDRSVLSAGN